MKVRQLCAGCTTFLQILEANGITKAYEVRAVIACEQHSSWTPQERDLSLSCHRRD
jgi:hypothetical protein